MVWQSILLCVYDAKIMRSRSYGVNNGATERKIRLTIAKGPIINVLTFCCNNFMVFNILQF